MESNIISTLETAHLAFKQLTQGLKTGQWEGFLNLPTDDFTFWFPVGSYQGKNVGKAKATEFFHYVSEKVFPEGLTLTLVAVTHNETTVVFEVQSQGKMLSYPYQNQAAIALDVRGSQICGYREYLGVFYQLTTTP